jgi:glucans biosynthesis protein
MFWYSPLNAQKPLSKKRPAVHDSDGLLIQNGAGELIWHPFSNPPQLQQNYFMDENIRGFGLLQRDRDPKDYKDNEAKYWDRPNAWVEPVGNWGKGSVRLLEIHSNDEYTDNVVALWTPAEPLDAGKSIDFEYNLTWSAADPTPAPLLEVASTQVIDEKKRNRKRFILHFSSNEPAPRAKGDIKADVEKFGNSVTNTSPVLSKTKNGWNVTFETSVPSLPAELDCVMERGNKIISEKWHYNLQP